MCSETGSDSVWVLAGWCTTNDTLNTTASNEPPHNQKLAGWLKASLSPATAGSSIGSFDVAKEDTLYRIDDPFMVVFREPWSLFLRTLIEELSSTPKPRLAVQYTSASPTSFIKWTLFLRVRTTIASVEDLTIRLSARLMFVLSHLHPMSSDGAEFASTRLALDTRITALCNAFCHCSPNALTPFCGVAGCYDHVECLCAGHREPRGIHSVLAQLEDETWRVHTSEPLSRIFLDDLLACRRALPSLVRPTTSKRSSCLFTDLPDAVLELILRLTGCNRTIQTIGSTCQRMFSIAESLIASNGCQPFVQLYPHQKHSLMWLRQRERRLPTGQPCVQCLPAHGHSNTRDPASRFSSSTASLADGGEFRCMTLCEAHDPLRFLSHWKELRLYGPASFYLEASGLPLPVNDSMLHRVFVCGPQQCLYGLVPHPSCVTGFTFASCLKPHTDNAVSLFFNNLDGVAVFGMASDRHRAEDLRQYMSWPRGGFLCDEPGLGKTLTMLGMIMKSSPHITTPTASECIINIPVSLLQTFAQAVEGRSLAHPKGPTSFVIHSMLPRELLRPALEGTTADLSGDRRAERRDVSAATSTSAQCAAQLQTVVNPPEGVIRMKLALMRGEVVTEAFFREAVSSTSSEQSPSSLKREKRLRSVLKQLGSDGIPRICFW